MEIPFNKPFLVGNELNYIKDSVESLKICGDGKYSKLCHQFFKEKYNYQNVFLTTSCTDALEMSAILCDIQPGDEVIMPSYTFVSTANAFVLRGAKIIFADSLEDHPNIDHKKIDALVTDKTKAIVVVHYAGVICEMDTIMDIANKHNLFVIEDAAQAIDSFYKGKPAGSFGQLAAFSFHETKNIISGEGGLLVVNDPKMVKRAEIIREKGTNRSQFNRGEVNKYGWIDIGSSFLPSDIIAAFLYAQLENIDKIQDRRVKLWNMYYNSLKKLADKGLFKLPVICDQSTNNAHLFYLILNSEKDRSNFLDHMRSMNINPVFHYLSLHKSEFYQNKHTGSDLPNADHFTSCLVRLPLFYSLKEEEVEYIIKCIYEYYE